MQAAMVQVSDEEKDGTDGEKAKEKKPAAKKKHRFFLHAGKQQVNHACREKNCNGKTGVDKSPEHDLKFDSCAEPRQAQAPQGALAEATLCRGNPVPSTWVEPHRFREGPSESFENRFGDMMRLISIEKLDMDVRTRRIGEGLKEFPKEVDVEIAHVRGRRRHLVAQKAPVPEIKNTATEAFVHGEEKKAVPANAGLVSKSLPDRFPKGNTGILNKVVIIDSEVACRLQTQAHAGMVGKKIQHVIEEGNSGFNGNPSLIKVDTQGNRRFSSLPLSFRYALVFHVSTSFKKVSISFSVPTVTRR